MPKYLFYKMTHDSGFAPNPFWGYLTLATCTPNHSEIAKNLKIGDWIIGVEGKELAHKRRRAGYKPYIEQSLIYIAKVNEILTLDEYFRDERFEAKKPCVKSGDYKERRGDNIYYIDGGKWKWLRGHDHEPKEICKLPDYKVFLNVEDLEKLLNNPEAKNKYGDILKDIRGNRVYISKEFLYFGDKCVEFDKHFSECIPAGKGIKYCPESLTSLFEDYINKLIEKYGFGVHGNPILYTIENKEWSCF